MARRPQSTTDDFKGVWDYLVQKGIAEGDVASDVAKVARSIHGMTYSLILWKFRLTDLPPHGQVFLDEMASDALQLLPQILMGYNKTAKLLMRGVLENALRHVYFLDHRIEFARLNRDGKWYLSMDDLCAYAKTHPDFILTEPRFNAIDQATSTYKDLSVGVHGRSLKDFEMRAALSEIQYDADVAQRALSFLKQCVQSVNFMLSVLHKPKFAAFNQEDKRIILHTFPPTARQIWVEHEPAA